ncbi:DUF7289 family protein [Haladaptatus sp. CMSO5]|uniref:DUF7289 family protein n=1 Tax=Haladaptatus sp. CMSO5 TaxID=3120514 RepID=UPI002FCE58B0
MSDVIGFVLIFSLISLSIGFIYVSGLGGLEDTRDAERINNAERAFDVMAHNIEDLSEQGAPSRATELRLDDAQLSVSNEVYIEYRFVNNADPTDTLTVNESLRPIVYTGQGDTSIVYEAGAVIREQADGSRMSRQPNFVLDKPVPVITIVDTRVSSPISVAGSRTVRVRAIHQGTTIASVEETNSDYTMWISITSPRHDAWASYFEDEGVCEQGPTTTGKTVTCKVSPIERGYVSIVGTTIEIE